MSNQRANHGIHSNYSLRFQESCTPEFSLHQVGSSVKSSFIECVTASLAFSDWMLLLLSLFHSICRTPCLICMSSRRFWKMQHFPATVYRYGFQLPPFTPPEVFCSKTGYVWNRNCLLSTPGTWASVTQGLLSAIHSAPLSPLISALEPIPTSPPPSLIRYS